MKNKKIILHRLALGILSLGLTMIILGGVGLYLVMLQLPNVDQLRDVHLQIPLKIYTTDGKLIGEFGEKRRTPVTLKQVPQQLVQGIIDTEDQRFYEHPGVDIFGLARAAKALYLTGKKTQGASTITMQVARNFFLSRKKTYTRKFREILLAIRIDHEFSKDEVLQLYLNKVYFGQSAYGVAAAAQVYYGKPLDQLTLPQMAMIAGLPQAPSRNNPIANPKHAIERRNHVLKRMFEQKHIDKTTYEAAIKAPITASYHRTDKQVDAPYVAEMVRQAVFKQIGDATYEEGLKVYTTINANMQLAANKSLPNGLIAYSMRHGYFGPEQNLGSIADVANWQKILQKIPAIAGLLPAAVTDVEDKSVTAELADGSLININWPGLSWARKHLADGFVGIDPPNAGHILKVGDVIRVRKLKSKWQLTQIPQVSGALVALNPNNGAILALNGGFSYQQNKFNCAVQATRQPGSSFKPFLYSAALDKDYTLASVINDAPIVMSDTGENSLWRPQNDTRKFYGPTRLRTGLIKSRNLVSIRLLQAVGIPYTINYAAHFGFDPNTLPQSLSLALGTGVVSPLNLTAAYAVFANGGYRTYPYLIDHVIDENGQTIYQAQPVTTAPDGNATQAITPENDYLMVDAMKDVIRHGTGAAAQVLHRSDLAGKTGTTNKQMDAWFAGFNGAVAATVWIGYDQPQSLHEYGARAALPIWTNFMKQALKHTPETNLARPVDIVTARIDPKTGLLAYPGQKNAIFEMFRKQYVPKERAANSNNDATEPESTALDTTDATNTDNNNDNELF
ncbi:MAG: penicillin-binding protein 1A [Gammaproteobacteria bacterium]|nr:penicillin-binding protein 1A [Gammaproteobacteria bacterium]